MNTEKSGILLCMYIIFSVFSLNLNVDHSLKKNNQQVAIYCNVQRTATLKNLLWLGHHLIIVQKRGPLCELIS